MVWYLGRNSILRIMTTYNDHPPYGDNNGDGNLNVCADKSSFDLKYDYDS